MSETRQKIINAGYQLIAEKGFNHTGISELLKLSGMPKGSFYHYFASKEDFGLKLIEHMTANMMADLKADFNNTDLTPLQRLHQRMCKKLVYLKANEFKTGCLLGSLGQELSAENDNFRLKIDEAFNQWLVVLANLFEEGQACGEIPKHIPAEDTAELFLNTMEGCLIRCKITKSAKSLETFENIFFNHYCRFNQPTTP